MDTVLDDPRALVPTADPKATGEFARFRAACSRFVNGDEHRRRREFLEDRLAGIHLADLRRTADAVGPRTPEFLPVAALARAVGFEEPDELPALVAVIAAAYPTGTGDADAETAAALARAPREEPELHLQLLVQAFAATAALARGTHPPVATTRRVMPDGTLVAVPLDDIPFGAGPRRCPAREIAELLATAARP